jgi:histidyl-tRNA synthetase
MATKLQPVRGTHDILPAENRQRRYLGGVWRELAERYGFGEISTPVFEFTEVFHRTLGDTSDVVTKETYTFTDRGGESLTLRPEFTAAVVRAFLSEGSLANELPCKFFYHGPAFRYERPQKGRLRQFHQVGVELLGAAEPEADVEVIALAAQGLKALGLSDKVTLEINSLGDAQSRKAYREALVAYLSAHHGGLSEESRVRLEKNPLRVLDSKDEGDRTIVAGAPVLEAHFTAEAQAFYARVREGLERLGIAYTPNHRLVRGLDYYNHTVFEFTTTQLGAQGTVLAGGRYDGLVAMMGGGDVPGVGWAAGVERMLALVDFANVAAVNPPAPVAVVPIGEAAEREAWVLAQQLREAGFAVDVAYKGNAGKRMKRADKIGAQAALMLGDDELAQGTVALKILATGEQKTVARSALAGELSALNG